MPRESQVQYLISVVHSTPNINRNVPLYEPEKMKAQSNPGRFQKGIDLRNNDPCPFGNGLLVLY